ncbi:MAG: aldehyde dehydrogenase family protein [Terriglobales bacterium]|jgi:phenylacetaldehyde dehydrogenase
MKSTTAFSGIDLSQLQTRMLINGELRNASSGSTFTLHDPATGQEIARVPQATNADVDAAVQAARTALQNVSWREMLPAARERLLQKLADLLERHADELAKLETLNQGMLLGVAQAVDVGASVQWLRYMAGWATKIHGDSIDISFPMPPGTKYQAIVRRQPVGVVGAIVPWNFPLLMAIWKIAPALACGCTVVLKPASDTPLTALRFAELALEAGFPPGVLNVIVGSGSTAGAALVQHPDVNKITLTGSTEVGVWIGQQCANTVKRVALELGGKSPVIVLDDCDPAVAAAGASAAIFFNQGQVCTAGSRLYVQKKQFERVVESVADTARNAVLGSGFDPATQIGPLVSQRQRENVLRFIDTGVKEGAQLVAGGTAADRDGYFVQPTVFANTTGRPLTLTREEVFGPVLIAQPYDDLEEVVREANNTVYGLAASVWTSNISKALRVAERLDAGTVWINSHNVVDPNMPFGGFKQSGIGREHGRSAIEAYTECKSICIAY